MADGAATLAALTAASVARIVPHLPAPPRGWIVSGGGARNPTLMKMLGERLKPATVETADAAGWSSQAMEAQAFAYLAVRCLNGLPLTFPSTTGVKEPMRGGVVVRRVRPMRLSCPALCRASTCLRLVARMERCRQHSTLPLPAGERVGVRGIMPLDRL